MYMEAVFERRWPLAMLVQSYEKPQVAAAAEPNEGTPSAQMEEQAEGEEEAQQNEEVHVTEIEPQGQADEGERIPIIMQQMQNEDEAAEQMQQDGESSDAECE